MKITDILDKSCVCVDLKSSTKKDIIKELVAILHKNGKVKDKGDIVNILIERENLGSTGIGYGIAIPHGKSEQVKSLVAVFGRAKPEVDFDSLDGEGVNLFFLLVTPKKDASGLHLKALARISSLLKDKIFREELLNVATDKEFYELIKREDGRME